MPRRKLSAAQSNMAIGMITAGQNQTEVAAYFNVSQSVISRLVNRHAENGSVSERPRTGRPRVTTRAEDRYITISARREALSTCRILRQQLQNATRLQVSLSTVRRRLNEIDLRSRRLLRRIPLTLADRRRRLDWARERVHWVEEWKSVLFTDESRYGRFSDSRRVRVWAFPLTPRNRRSVQEVHPFRGGTITVWAGISYNNRTQLMVLPGNMNSQIYLDEVINNVLPVFQHAIGNGFQFLDDNARPHRAARVLAALAIHDIQHLQLPPRSPDLNVIEHAWDQLQRALDNHQPSPETMQQLRELLPQLWNGLDQRIFNNLIESMPRRCRAVIEARGGYTLY